MNLKATWRNSGKFFNERMNIAEDALVYRVERTKEATPANAPILYQYGAFGKRLGKYDKVDPTL